MVVVYRAPMRSRRDDVDVAATIQRARALNLCGFGGVLRPYGLFWLGRINGSWFYDAEEAAASIDLVHVWPCRWLSGPLLEPEVPAAVLVTFQRGGRNFQQMSAPRSYLTAFVATCG